MLLAQLMLLSHMFDQNEMRLSLLFLSSAVQAVHFGFMETYPSTNCREHAHGLSEAYIYVWGLVIQPREKNCSIAWVQAFKYRHAQYA